MVSQAQKAIEAHRGHTGYTGRLALLVCMGHRESVELRVFKAP